MRKPHPFNRVHELCGGDVATRELRAGIAKFVEEQARHFMGMNNPRWMDRALESPEWACLELQMCNAAKAEGVRCMQTYIAPWCEKLAQTKAEENGEGIAQIKFSMSKKWTSAKEYGSRVVMNFVTKHRNSPTRPTGLHEPTLHKIAPSRNGQIQRVEMEL